MTAVTSPFDATGFTYDGVGNILTRYEQFQDELTVIPGDSVTYSYVPVSNLIDSISGDAIIYFTYDNTGSTTTKADNDYFYNIAESSDTGTFTNEYIYMGVNRLATDTGDVYYYLNDQLGTPFLMTDDTGRVVWEGRYEPFGGVTVVSSSTVENNFRFAGQYFGSETGLHYSYHRYYDPRIGRYLRADPIRLEGGINLYAYVQNNPVNFLMHMVFLDGETLGMLL